MTDIFCEELSTKLPFERIVLGKSESLFLQDQKIKKFYFLRQGVLKLVRSTIEGEQSIMHVAYAGEFIAEASLFSEKYHCFAIAESESEIISYNKADFLAYLDTSSSAMLSLLKTFAQQVRDLRVINEIKNINSAKQRILAYLSNAKDGNNVIQLSISLKDTAYKIGLAHETFYRELKKLELDGLLTRKGRTIKLLKQ